MKKLGLLAVAALAAATLAFVPSAHAGGLCDDGGSGLGTGQHAIGPGGTGTVWIDDRDYATGNGVWIYLESNDRPNSLERGGTNAIGDADTCNDGVTPDTLVF